MDGEDQVNEVPDDYLIRVGERLRSIRKQKRLALQDVEAKSGQQFKASVLGAYERGERAISVPRLQGLARFYNVPVDQLLPVDDDPGFEGNSAADLRGVTRNVTIDLQSLENLSGPEATMLTRYLTMIQMQRQDFNGKMLTIRNDDLRAIACMLGVGHDTAGGYLDDLGLSLIP